MKLYKLTDEHGRTHKGLIQWGLNITHDGSEFLEDDHLYDAYLDPLLAIFMNPIHFGFKKPRLWEVEGEPTHIEPDKVGCKSLTVIGEIDLPEITLEQRLAFGILSAMEVYDEKDFSEWARKWLNGEDRTDIAAQVIFHTTHPIANAAWFAFLEAIRAGHAVASTFRPESRPAIRAVTAAIKVRVANNVAQAANYAARAVATDFNTIYETANAADNAARAKPDIDLVALAHKAMEVKT